MSSTRAVNVPDSNWVSTTCPGFNSPTSRTALPSVRVMEKPRLSVGPGPNSAKVSFMSRIRSSCCLRWRLDSR